MQWQTKCLNLHLNAGGRATNCDAMHRPLNMQEPGLSRCSRRLCPYRMSIQASHLWCSRCQRCHREQPAINEPSRLNTGLPDGGLLCGPTPALRNSLFCFICDHTPPRCWNSWPPTLRMSNCLPVAGLHSFVLPMLVAITALPSGLKTGGAWTLSSVHRTSPVSKSQDGLCHLQGSGPTPICHQD